MRGRSKAKYGEGTDRKKALEERRERGERSGCRGRTAGWNRAGKVRRVWVGTRVSEGRCVEELPGRRGRPVTKGTKGRGRGTKLMSASGWTGILRPDLTCDHRHQRLFKFCRQSHYKPLRPTIVPVVLVQDAWLITQGSLGPQRCMRFDMPRYRPAASSGAAHGGQTGGT